MIAHIHGDCQEGETVKMSLQLDKAGQAVAFASPGTTTPNQADDKQWREFTADPRYRRALVTDGRNEAGQAIALALVAAGATTVFVGIPERWRPFKGEDRLASVTNIHLVSLDIGDQRSVAGLAADIGPKTDILVNTNDHVRPGGLLTRNGAGRYREEIERSYLGFVHLAQSFGPIMRGRGADGAGSAVAWANIFSIYSLSNWPAYGAYSASQAAALSLSQCLRAELRGSGVRVMNLFTGPIESDWFQGLPPPKVSPEALAAALIRALKSGSEDVFVGDVAEDFRRRLTTNPKALERELGW
nr:SDR family NAD(P)-dependent oxidoreductase [Bradyrhizobium sp. CCBAU 53338]